MTDEIFELSWTQLKLNVVFPSIEVGIIQFLKLSSSRSVHGDSHGKRFEFGSLKLGLFLLDESGRQLA